MPASPFDPDAAIPRLLVSVRDAAEAEAACAAGADLVDGKDPFAGALGALQPETVRGIVARVAGRALTSAVAGEPDDAEALASAVSAMAATGVDYVKVAVRLDFTDAVLLRAAGAAPGRLIAVLFAERGVPPNLVPRLAAAGFAGAMVDTAGKDAGRLTDWLAPQALDAFTAACREVRLLSGLAGSLRLEDIPRLVAFCPGYLGFRGGLCEGGDRTRRLDPALVAGSARALRALACRDAA